MWLPSLRLEWVVNSLQTYFTRTSNTYKFGSALADEHDWIIEFIQKPKNIFIHVIWLQGHKENSMCNS